MSNNNFQWQNSKMLSEHKISKQMQNISLRTFKLEGYLLWMPMACTENYPISFLRRSRFSLLIHTCWKEKMTSERLRRPIFFHLPYPYIPNVWWQLLRSINGMCCCICWHLAHSWGEKAPILNIFLYRSENWGPDLTVFFIFIENSLKGSIATKLYIKRWD